MNVFLTILGSGAALPIGARRCSAQVLNIGGFKVLIDCAEATQDRIRYNHLKLQSLSTIISHLHGDHFFGLPGLLSTMHLCGRTEPIERLVPHIAGVDLLCLEFTIANDMEQLASERKHLTAGQAGRLARLAGVKQLLLTHISARYREDEPLISQSREEFENCLLAADNMRIEIKK